MSIGSGMGSSFGFAAETVYGTRIAANRFIKVRSAAINRVNQRQQGEGIITGSFGPNVDHFVETTSAATATVAVDVPYTRMGVLLQTLMGGTSTVVQQASTAAYLQTHTLGDTTGDMFTAQVGVPYRDTTVRCHELTGGKITSAEFSCERGGLLQANFQIDGRAFSDAATLATVTHNAGVRAFHGGQLLFRCGTFNSEVGIAVRDVSVSFDRPHDTEGYVSGSAFKTQPVLNGPAEIKGSVTVDWTSAGGKALQDFAIANTVNSVVIEWIADVAIASTHFPTFRITLPSVTWDGDMQGADGASELSSKFDFTWRDNSTNAPTITYMSTDLTL